MRCMLWTSTRTSLALVATMMAVVGLTACGGGGGSANATASSGEASAVSAPDEVGSYPAVNTDGGSAGSVGSVVVATVAGTPITKTAVNHWMGTLAGGDSFESTGMTLPEGLISDPPNYARCVAQLEAIEAKAPHTAPKPNAVALLTECRKMYLALRAQAMEFVIRIQATVDLARELGITASEGEVLQFFKRFRAEHFPTEADLQSYLSQRRLTLSDELTVSKLDILDEKVLHKIEAKQITFADAVAHQHKWAARTNCSPGYIVERCKQYTNQQTPSDASPAFMVERIAAIETGACFDPAACRF